MRPRAGRKGIKMRPRAGRSSWQIHLDRQQSDDSDLNSSDIISNMPEDVLTHIMSLLLPSDKGKARLLSTKWLRLSAPLQTRLLIRRQRLNELELPIILNKDFRSLTHLSLNKCPGMRNLKLAHSKLEFLNLAYCGTLKNVQLNTPNLQNLVFHAPRIRPCVVEFANCQRLRYLHLVGVDMNNILTNCNESFPFLKSLTLAGCDRSGDINISSNSMEKLSLIRFNEPVALNIDAPRLTFFYYNGTTVPEFQNVNFPACIVAHIDLNPNRYHRPDANWFRRLVGMLRCLNHAQRLELYATYERHLIIPAALREALAPPLREMFCIVVRTNSRSGNIVDLVDSMLWICPRVTYLICRSDSWVSTLQFAYGDVALGLPADLCGFCTSPVLRCWRHSVTWFTIIHPREEARQQVREYLQTSLTVAERDDIDWALMEVAEQEHI